MARSCTILLIEDDEDDYELFVDALNTVPDARFEVTRMRNGVEALSYLQKQGNEKPHYIVLDINLPLKDGFETLREIKAQPDLHHIPVYIFSMSAHQHHIEKSWAYGCDAYHQKPNTVKDYEACVIRMFSEYKSN